MLIKKVGEKNISKFLIIQTAFIGDVILATSLVESLKQKYPEAKIDFLLRKGNESLLQNHPKINEVIIFDKKNRKYKNLLKIISIIRKNKYDVVINVQRFFTTGIITSLSGAKSKIGFDKNPLSFLFSHKVKHQITNKGTFIHEVNRNLQLLKPLSEPEFIRPKLYPDEKDFNTIPQKDYICFAPGSVWKTKQFPIEKWIELADKVPQNLVIYLIGGKDDFEICEEIKSKSQNKNIENIAGSINLLKSAALISGAKMTYTNDSAPMHLASAMNAPVAAIFCSTVPEFGFGPLSDESFIFQNKHNLKCRPCNLHGKKSCPEGHFLCGHIEIDEMSDIID